VIPKNNMVRVGLDPEETLLYGVTIAGIEFE
jgi:hypothetical protein